MCEWESTLTNTSTQQLWVKTNSIVNSVSNLVAKYTFEPKRSTIHSRSWNACKTFVLALVRKHDGGPSKGDSYRHIIFRLINTFRWRAIYLLTNVYRVSKHGRFPTKTLLFFSHIMKGISNKFSLFGYFDPYAWDAALLLVSLYYHDLATQIVPLYFRVHLIIFFTYIIDWWA